MYAIAVEELHAENSDIGGKRPGRPKALTCPSKSDLELYFEIIERFEHSTPKPRGVDWNDLYLSWLLVIENMVE